MIPFVPISLVVLGLPLLGGASSAKAGVKKALANVDGVLLYAKVFLFAFAAISAAIFIIWVVLILRKRRFDGQMQSVLMQLSRIRSDIELLKEK